MSNKSNLDYDGAKKMLNTLRALNESKASAHKILKEEENPQQTQDQSSDFMVVNDVEVRMNSADKTDTQLTDDEKNGISQLVDNFRQQVSDLADFKPGFTINMAETEFRLDGTISDQDINFVLITGNENSGVYINADMLKLSDEINVTIAKLVKFQHSFEDTGNKLINDRKYN